MLEAVALFMLKFNWHEKKNRQNREQRGGIIEK